MQYKSYSQFLSSNLWTAYRSIALKESGHRCRKCGTKRGRLEVHHKKYTANWNDVKLADLEVLCQTCHFIHHHHAANDPQYVLSLESEVLNDSP